MGGNICPEFEKQGHFIQKHYLIQKHYPKTGTYGAKMRAIVMQDERLSSFQQLQNNREKTEG
jgi:hypothetical protein